MPPIICFGQQPCGFFPKRFLVAKIMTARRVQREMGGEIVFFYHDADHDPRETKTTLRHIQSGKPLDYNFEYENKVQRKFSPLYLKRVPAEWRKKMGNTLPNYVSKELVEIFKTTPCANVADFCLGMYERMKGPDGMGLLEGIRVVRSSDPAVRGSAIDITPTQDFFVDVPYEKETVRARYAPAHGNTPAHLQLHEGGPVYIDLPLPGEITREQVTPSRDTRLKWMQSVIHATHYIAGLGEQGYLKKEEAPELTFLNRDEIDRLDEAWVSPA